MKYGKEKPAILGGKPAVTIKHELANHWPILTAEDEKAVLRVMRDGNISTHHVIRELEKDYCLFTGQPYALAHCNGTAALLAAFYALGLKPGDEVLVPSATFWASVLPMLWLGVVPIFCESEEERLGIDPKDMVKKITSKTKAIVVVHLWGMPSKMTEIISIAKKYNLKIVEDASHSQGAIWKDRLCGTLGDVSVFSLQGDKLAPAGEGGILLCKDYEIYEKAICLGDITRIIELKTPARRLAATSMGIKTRIAPLSAAIARVQLKHLKKNNEKRNKNLIYLSKHLEKLGFHTFLAPKHIKRTYFEYLIEYDAKKNSLPQDILMKALSAEGCHVTAPRYPLLHQQPFFTEGLFKDILRLGSTKFPTYNPTDLPKTQMVNGTLIKLPSFPSAKKDILNQYIKAFTKVVTNAKEIAEKIIDNKH